MLECQLLATCRLKPYSNDSDLDSDQLIHTRIHIELIE